MKIKTILIIILAFMAGFVFADDATTATAVSTTDAITQIVNVLLSLCSNQSWSVKLIGFLASATLIIGHASALVKALGMFGIDPKSKTGQEVALAGNILSNASTILSKIALHPAQAPAAK